MSPLRGRLSNTKAISERPLSGGYRQKMVWDYPSDLRPDQSISPRNAPLNNPTAGDQCLSGAMKELGRSGR